MFKTIIIAALVALAGVLWAGDGCEACAKSAEISQKDLAEAIAAKKVVVIDVNGSESFKKGHIPGAIDYEANAKDIVKVLPADKGTLIVAYCGGPKCGAWEKGAHAAEQAGYTNIKHFKGGLSGWTEAGGKLESSEAH